MKILYVDVALEGHHIPYLYGLLSDEKNILDKVLLLPYCECDFNVKTYMYKKKYDYRKVKEYYEWFEEIKIVADKEKPDIIHFLYGDILYRHFASNMKWLRKYYTIITFHQFRMNKLINFSIKKIFRNISIGIVHTSYLVTKLTEMNIHNVKHIEYPQLYDAIVFSKIAAKTYYSLKPDIPVLGVIGNICFYKGFDLLLDALKTIHIPFQLLIAGKEGYFNREYIERNIGSFREKVNLQLCVLSDFEFCQAIAASDYIVLPYRKKFDGASGPLTEAVWNRIPVIAANHGSLGNIVEQNQLGYTFESENVNSLSSSIVLALQKQYPWNESAEKYREHIKINVFQKNYRDLYYRIWK